MRTALDLAAIREQHPLPSVVSGAGVKLKRAGNEWKACCPLHADRSPSFTIYSGGLRFQCFGCGAQGDVFDFVGAFYHVDLRGAVEILSGGQVPEISVVSLRTKDRGDRTGEALAIWRAAVPVEETLAEVYLRSRGLTVAPPLSLRYAELPYGRGSPMPCLVCGVSSLDGPLCGLQRIYLAPDGRGKAELPKPKLSLGRVAGGAIRLGPLDGGELVVCEGPETGLSLLQELGRPVWVSAGASMLAAMQFPESVQSLAIAGDADDAGRAAAAKAAESFAQRGLKVRTFFPPSPFNDFNDMLLQERALA